MSEPRALSSLRLPRSSRQAWLIAMASVVLLIVCVTQGYAEKLRDSVRKQSISIRLVGRAAPLPISSFGANYASYVAVLQSGNDNKDVSFVKLVYRFMDYDRNLPVLFMNYDYVHKFRAVRQADCDEPADALLYSRHVTPVGGLVDSEFSFEYAKNATSVAIPATTVLPCYTVAPPDYKGSHLILQDPSRPVMAEKESGLTPAPKVP